MSAKRYVLILTENQWRLVRDALDDHEPAGWITDDVEHAPHGDAAALLEMAEMGMAEFGEFPELRTFLSNLREHWLKP